MVQMDEKCVLILDEALPAGILANTAAILGITIGKQFPQAVGSDVTDKTGCTHLGIVAFPVPILKGTPKLIQELRQRLAAPEFSDIITVDFSELAQGCKAYEEFTEKLQNTEESDLRYLGLALCGAKKKVNRLTGNLPLLR